MTLDSKKPWECQPGETSRQYEAFCIYRDMGVERSISEVAKVWSDSGATSRLNVWSSKLSWVERATAYDAYIEEIKRFRQEEEIKEMAARHAREAQLFQDKAIERLSMLDVNNLKPQDVIKFYDISVRIERLSRGVPTENIKQENTMEVERDAITTEKLKIPKVRKAANKFIKAIADSQSSADGTSTNNK